MAFSKINKDRLKNILRIPFAWALVFASIATVLIFDLPDYVRAVRAQLWPSYPATIIKSEFFMDPVVFFRDPYFKIDLAYRFSINGQEYVGHNYSLQRQDGLLGYDAGLLLSKFKPGCNVTVKVENGDPASSVLETPPDSLRLLLHMAVILTLAGMLYLSVFPVVSDNTPP